ncbi:WD repeat-containing protein 3-like [Hibiscus syriacus]|uniref:WD repeat-containing protein 3-like n=1 Tax=Hibiscus syriacus TaxID=106335 RepID=UPI001924CF17|nr:WD repeat-containing protein 3-like [Hibiscus syriacus]
MVKSYLRYEQAASFGVIVSVESNITYDSSGKHLLAPALEKIGVWHVRQVVCTKTLSPSVSSRGSSLFVNCVVSSPSSLVGSVLASGSKDNDIIIYWDVVGETGLFRLRGHRDQITDLVFLDSDKKLVTSSKDKFLRVWDLETQHCMQIVSGHHSEIWSIDVDPDERYLVTGSADLELRLFYNVKHELMSGESMVNVTAAKTGNDRELSTQNKWEVLKPFGEITRQSKDRVATVRFSKSGNLLACQVAGKTVELFLVLDEVQSKCEAKQRLKNRKKEKKSAKMEVEETENVEANHETKGAGNTLVVKVPDVFKLLPTILVSKKICSISFCPVTPESSLASLALSLNNNLLEFYSIKSDGSEKTLSINLERTLSIELERTLSIELEGHRSDVRSVTLSSDNSFLMSTSHNAVKIWNPSTGSCLKTIDSGYGLCGLIVPITNMEFEVVGAHGGSVRSIATIPNGNGFVTGSADHDVKFWEYINQKPGQDSKSLTILNVRTMKMNDDVLVVAVSPDAKYVAVALLDCTVKILFMDSFKIFLSLYGHKLPVLCMDISSDGDLIVTGSADKNLRIWGLDFGDCHKSIFAHADRFFLVNLLITNSDEVIFQCYGCSICPQHTLHVQCWERSSFEDCLLKYWDADKFELLLTLEGHHAAVWCLAVSNRGDFVVTGSHDRSIRRWDRTEEPFFIEEEKEKRLEEIFEAYMDDTFEDRNAPKEELPEEGAVALAGKRTLETLTATDSIIDALEVAEVELKRIAEHEEEQARGKVAEFQPNLIMLGLSPSGYVLRALSNISTNDLEQTLLHYHSQMPSSCSLIRRTGLQIMTKLASMLLWMCLCLDVLVELVCRIVTILLQTHHSLLISTPSARPVLSVLKEIIYARVKECHDTLGFNLAAMDHLKQLMASRSDALFRDAKSKLVEIRSQQLKRFEARTETKTEKRKKKKHKK